MKTLVLLSGGMDSSTALGLVWGDGVPAYGDEVEAVSFNYGQRHVRELESAKAVAAHYRAHHTILDLRGAMEAFAGSALTGNGDVPEGHYEDESMKRTVVPNRNMIMLSLAGGLAISRKADVLVYAAHAGDHAIYPDCRPGFVEAVDKALRIGNYDAPVVRAPFIDMTKAAIARLGADLDVPFELTYSCYNGGEKHCGKCGTCVERIEAFNLAGVTDPTEYSKSELDEPTWAVATESEVIINNVTHAQAVKVLEEHGDKSGAAIVTSDSADWQLRNKVTQKASEIIE